MRAACITFVAGAWWLQRQPALWERRSIVVLVGVAAALAIAVRVDDARRARRGPAASPARRVAMSTVVAIALCSVGFGWASWRAAERLDDALAPALEGRDVTLIGTIASLPSVDARATRFEFAVESVTSAPSVPSVPSATSATSAPSAPSVPSRDNDRSALRVPARLALGWYQPRGDVTRGAIGGAPHGVVRGLIRRGDGAVPRLLPGQRWRLTVRLKRPHGAANPHGFDYEYWLLESGVRATGSVVPGGDDDATPDEAEANDRPPTSTVLLDPFVWTASHAIERVRSLLRDRIEAALADGRPPGDVAPYAGVLVALVVGDQRAIAQSDWEVFNRTGIGHLVSISGLHVSMLATLGAWAVLAWWRRHPAWCARLAAPKAAAAAGAGVALLYCLLAGFGVPAQRTLYMIAVVAVATWVGRSTSVSRVLCLALATVVAIDPWAVTGSGFWLSFAAVAAIFYVTSGRLTTVGPHDRPLRRALSATRIAMRVQWAVTLALTPLTLLFFQQVSLVGPLANAIAIPLVSFVVTPLALAGVAAPTLIGTVALKAAHGLVALLASGLQWLSGSPVAVWTGAAPSPWAFVAAMLGVAWWLAPRGLPHRWTGALWLVPLFAWPPDRPAVGEARLTALDIGQGTAVLVETHGTTTLFDTGPSYAPASDAGSRVIAPYLRAIGVARLDVLVVSHNDNDHSGGALSVLKAVTVDRVVSSLELDTPIVRASRDHVRCEAGQAWSVDGVRFELLAPDPAVYATRVGRPPAKPNARSCVLRVEAHGRVALLTADIERPQEAALVERRSDALAADVLTVPHHGSGTSSSDAFLDAVRPSLALVQAGYLNRFGHPRADVLERYAARGIDVLRNDRDGAITVTLGGDAMTVDRYRTSHARYWHAR